MTSNEKIRELAVELKILENTAEGLRSRLSFVSAALSELDLANKTLEGIERAKAGSSILVPIGGGSFIKAKLDNPDKIVYGVGARVTLEKTLKDAKEGITTRINKLTETKASIEQHFEKVLKKMGEDQSRMQQISAEINREAGTRDVRKTSSGT